MKHALWILLAFAVAGCPGGDDAPPTEAAPTGGGGDAGQITDSWMHAVAQDPGRMEPFERGPAGDAWLTFFHNDLNKAAESFDRACKPSSAGLKERAAQGFPCIGAARTHLELAELYDTVSEIDRIAQRQFYLHRRVNAEDVLASVHQPFFEGIVLLHGGDADAGKAKLQAYMDAGQAEPMLAALAQKIVSGLGNDPLIDRVYGGGQAPATGDFSDLPSSPATRHYAQRLAFVAAVAAGDLDAASGMFRTLSHNEADLREELQGSESLLAPTVFHHDSAFLRAMARYHAGVTLKMLADGDGVGALRVAAQRLANQPVGELGSAPSLEDGLALVLFSTTPSPSDLWSEQASWPDRSALIRRFGGTVSEFARAPTTNLADLDPFVNGSNLVKLRMGELLGDASQAGANMNSDMGLSDRFQGRLLMERAWQYQRAFDVRLDDNDGADLATAGVAAKSLFELAMDKTPTPPNSRLKAARVSFRNDPPFLADLARAHLDTRHPYDANEFVRPLTELYPELIATREALASLDSAWNPARKGSVR